MPWSQRVREFAFSMDVAGLAPAAQDGTTADNEQLAWSVIGEPSFPTMALSLLTETSGRPYELALPGPLPLANRRLEWNLAEWDERILRLVGRPYGYLGAVTANEAAATEGKPVFAFKVVKRGSGATSARTMDGRVKSLRFEFEGGLTEATPTGLTGGEYARLNCVVEDVQKFRVIAYPAVAPGAAIGTGVTIREIDLIGANYKVGEDHDLWAGMKTALAIA